MQIETVKRFRDLTGLHRKIITVLIFGVFPIWLVGLFVYEFCMGIQRAARDTWLEVSGACAEMRDFWRATRT